MPGTCVFAKKPSKRTNQAVRPVILFFTGSKNSSSKKKLELIEGRYMASIWKCFDQHYIGESIEMLNLMLQFPLILQWNAEQNMSRSMPGSTLQLVVTFCSSKNFELGKK